MNIELRPSGGRGEYELAGRQGSLHVQDLFGLPIFIEILPGISINSYSHCVLKDGKPRIRLLSAARNAHPAFLIAAAMLLPKPRREKHETRGKLLPAWEQFVVQTVRIDVAPRAGGLLVCPLMVRLETGDGGRLDINFAERMARVVRIWTAAATSSTPLAAAVREHAAAFTSDFSTQAQLVGSFSKLHLALQNFRGDMLRMLERHFHLEPFLVNATQDASSEIEADKFKEDVNTNPNEARIERVRKWRLASVRGSSASSFRRSVREAYNSMCVFSGQRLPRTGATSTAGVDAAHILPWSLFDLDAVSNGLCLSKQCHWAFDEGVLRLNYDKGSNSYVISIPPRVRMAAKAAQFDLKSFDSLTGPIPPGRLPANQNLWPSTKYLKELNGFLDDESA